MPLLPISVLKSQLTLQSNEWITYATDEVTVKYVKKLVNAGIAVINESNQIRLNDKYTAHTYKIKNRYSASTNAYKAKVTTLGREANAAATCHKSHASTQNDIAHASVLGHQSEAFTVGIRSHSTATGKSSTASAMGIDSVAVSIGNRGAAKAALNNWIVLARYNIGKLIEVKTAKIDGEVLKADIYYYLDAVGNFVELTTGDDHEHDC